VNPMSILQVRDIKMTYTERGDGPTVVALHAATSNSTELGWLAHIIAHEGFTVVTPDLRGHGATPNPAPDLHLSRLADDILEFIYLLGRTPLHGAGFSLGGAVALHAAHQRPELFRSLVLMGTSYRAPSPEQVKKAIGPEEKHTPQQKAIFDRQQGAVVGWQMSPDALRAVICPVLIIAADRDEYNDPEDSLLLYRSLPNAEMLIVPHSDHIGLVRNPMVIQAVRDFYARVPR
jgi:pimeloyl-ACP methyl ester carboxylesterase